ncbi:hypothetical protein [Aromatoleum aromaticum]|uniref:hypothetical protein n=1 Tax=Aromatoleum aromaticum TaxID=551760 RepID=UPI0005A1E4F0|nr:hypothetical protein [Aromatoleum aromaticum]NMG54489.1 hypothetical protein [Aromatoleum aromaticum]
MKPALIAIGTLALGASALYFLDPARTRGARARRLPIPCQGPGATTMRRSSPPAEPGEVEEITGTTVPPQSSY